MCLISTIPAFAWFDQADLELFDLVEEVGRDFYELLELNSTAATADIKRAYRVLSLRLHPDKNKSEGAEVAFRQMVAVVNVLKDEQLRKKYDEVLANGLPTWRNPVFYYRRARKLGLLEMSLILSLVLTIGHYLCCWAAHWERKLTIVSNSKPKKRAKGQPDPTEELLAELRPPTFLDLLPFKVFWFSVFLAQSTPLFMSEVYYFSCEKLSEFKDRKKKNTNEDDVSDESDEISRPKRTKTTIVIPEYEELYGDETAPVVSSMAAANGSLASTPESGSELKVRGVWSEEDVHALIKACKKHPVGTHERWEKVAAAVCRSADDVLAKVKEMKALKEVKSGPGGRLELSNPSSKTDLRNESRFETPKPIEKPIEKWPETPLVSSQLSSSIINSDVDHNTANAANSEAWSDLQQKAFEKALVDYPKGVEARWDCIADSVPGKDKVVVVFKAFFNLKFSFN